MTQFELSYRQKNRWIDRFPVLSDFKMQHGDTSRILSHFRDLLTATHPTTLTHQYHAVVRVGAQVAIAVTDDDQIAASLYVSAGIDHIASTGGEYRFTLPSADIDAFIDVGLKSPHYPAGMRPLPSRFAIYIRD